MIIIIIRVSVSLSCGIMLRNFWLGIMKHGPDRAFEKLFVTHSHEGTCSESLRPWPLTTCWKCQVMSICCEKQILENPESRKRDVSSLPTRWNSPPPAPCFWPEESRIEIDILTANSRSLMHSVLSSSYFVPALYCCFLLFLEKHGLFGSRKPTSLLQTVITDNAQQWRKSKMQKV